MQREWLVLELAGTGNYTEVVSRHNAAEKAFQEAQRLTAAKGVQHGCVERLITRQEAARRKRWPASLRGH